MEVRCRIHGPHSPCNAQLQVGGWRCRATLKLRAHSVTWQATTCRCDDKMFEVLHLLSIYVNAVR